MARHGRHFGWRPDQPDHRDYYYGAPPANLRATTGPSASATPGIEAAGFAPSRRLG